MAGGDRNNPLSDAQFRNPKVKHITIRDRWWRLHPARGRFDFGYLEAQILRCRKFGKPYVIGVMTGADCAPSWLGGQISARLADNKVHKFVAPWSADLAPNYEALQIEIDRRFASDPLFCQTWCTGPTVPSQEMHTNRLETHRDFTAAKMRHAWWAAIDTMASLFAAQTVVVSVSGQGAVLPYLRDVTDRAARVLGDRAAFQFNSLGPQTSETSHHVQELKYWDAKGYRVGSEQRRGGEAQVIKLPKWSWLDFNVCYPRDEAKF